jgi:hypothetical protein
MRMPSDARRRPAGRADKHRSLAGRIGALALHASGGTNTGPARQAFLSRFEKQVDPDGQLDPDERARRAAFARRRYFTELALASSRARRRRRARP